MNFCDRTIDPKQLSPLNLAYIGDCVYELMVRESVVAEANRPVAELNKETLKYVTAKAQTAAYDAIKDILTEEEQTVFRRGRNAKVGHSPKSATHGEYHMATGVEALFGYLYLSGRKDRMKELFQLIFNR